MYLSFGRSVGPSVGRSVGRSVGPLRLCKTRIFWLIFAEMRSYTVSYERQSCFESLRYYSCRFICLSVHLSICPSIYVTLSIHAETQSGRIVARSGLFKNILFRLLASISSSVISPSYSYSHWHLYIKEHQN